MSLNGRSWLSDNWIPAAAALVIYSVFSFSLFFVGTGIFGHLGQQFIGDRADPLIEMWALAWWPHALANHLNPFITRVLWPPTGYNLAWTPSIPGPSLATYPVTRLFGPVFSYNLFCLFCPVAAALSAFLLCHYVSRRLWPSLLGGYIFGYSPYMLSHMMGHLFLLFSFPVPLLALLVLLRVDLRVSRAAFVGSFSALVLFEFLSSAELFATTTVFGSLALVLSYLLSDRESRRALWNIAAEIGLVCVIAIALLTPHLYYILAYRVEAPINPGSMYSNDLLTFVTPPPVLYFGQVFFPVAFRLTLSPIEAAGYLGPGVWIILVLYTQAFWSSRRGKFLIMSLFFIGMMSLGPTLHVAGEAVSLAPWWPLSKLPLLNQALPGRFGMYLFLTAAVIVSLYVSEGPSPAWSRAILGVLCLFFLAPNLSLFRSAVSHVNVPLFFRSQEYKRYLTKGDNVLVLPYARTEDGLLWQIDTDYYFRLAAARLTLPPAEFSRWPVLATLESGEEIMDFAEQLKAFLGAHQVKAVIVDSESALPWAKLLSEAGLSPVTVGGVLLYNVPGAVLVSYRSASVHKMAEREASISFGAMISAANRYLAAGFPLAKLDPWEAQRRNVIELPGDTRSSSHDSRWWRNLWLGPWGGSLIGVGVVGDYQDVRFLVERYRADSTDVFFPYPARLADTCKNGTGQLASKRE